MLIMAYFNYYNTLNLGISDKNPVRYPAYIYLIGNECPIDSHLREYYNQGQYFANAGIKFLTMHG